MVFKKYPPVEHLLVVGKPGSYKDVTAVRYCYENHKRKGRKVFSNQHLGFPHTFIEDYDEFPGLFGDNWNPSIAYIHDIGALFHSRDFATTRKAKIGARKSMINNYRKRGIQIVGTLHREMEVDIELRLMMDWFIYPKVLNNVDDSDMEHDVIVLDWYDRPDMYEKGKRPVKRSYYTNAQKYAILFNTLEEIKI